MCVENRTTVRLDRRLGTLDIDNTFYETMLGAPSLDLPLPRMTPRDWMGYPPQYWMGVPPHPIPHRQETEQQSEHLLGGRRYAFTQEDLFVVMFVINHSSTEVYIKNCENRITSPTLAYKFLLRPVTQSYLYCKI